MSTEQEEKYLNDILDAIDNPRDSSRKMSIITIILGISGVLIYGAAFFIAKSGSIEPKHCVSIGLVGGVLLGLSVFMSVNKKFTPLILPHIDRASVENRLLELKI